MSKTNQDLRIEDLANVTGGKDYGQDGQRNVQNEVRSSPAYAPQTRAEPYGGLNYLTGRDSRADRIRKGKIKP